LLDFCAWLCENSDVPVIDFHTHIFPPEIIARREAYLERDDWFRNLYADPRARMVTADTLVESMDENGVDAAVAFGFARVNPAAEGAAPELERCMQKGLCGLGEPNPPGQGCALDDPRLDEIVRVMTRWKRPVLIHCAEPVGHNYPGRSTSTLQSFYGMALRHPAAMFVAAHWGGGLFFYELMLEVREALKNVYYDTTASLYLYQDTIFALAAQIVPQKVLSGTDYPLIGQGRFLQCVRDLGLTADAQEAVLEGNAARLLL